MLVTCPMSAGIGSGPPRPSKRIKRYGWWINKHFFLHSSFIILSLWDKVIPSSSQMSHPPACADTSRGWRPEMNVWQQLWSEGRESRSRSPLHWADWSRTALPCSWLSNTGTHITHTCHSSTYMCILYQRHNVVGRVSKQRVFARVSNPTVLIWDFSHLLRTYFCLCGYDWQRGVWRGLQRATVPLRGQEAAKHSSADRLSRCLNTTFYYCLRSDTCIGNRYASHARVRKHTVGLTVFFSSHQRQLVTGSRPTVHRLSSETWEPMSCPPPSQQQGSQRRQQHKVTQGRGEVFKHCYTTKQHNRNGYKRKKG